MSLTWIGDKNSFDFAPKFYADCNYLNYNIYHKTGNKKYQLEIVKGDDIVLELLFHEDVEKLKSFCEVYSTEYSRHVDEIKWYKQGTFGDDEINKVTTNDPCQCWDLVPTKE